MLPTLHLLGLVHQVSDAARVSDFSRSTRVLDSRRTLSLCSKPSKAHFCRRRCCIRCPVWRHLNNNDGLETPFDHQQKEAEVIVPRPDVCRLGYGSRRVVLDMRPPSFEKPTDQLLTCFRSLSSSDQRLLSNQYLVLHVHCSGVVVCSGRMIILQVIAKRSCGEFSLKRS